MKLIDFVLIILLIGVSFIGNVAHRDYLQNKPMFVVVAIMLEVRDIAKRLSSVCNKVVFMDSMHYHYCDWQVRDSVELEVRLW